MANLISIANLIVLIFTACVVWQYTRAAQKNNELQEKPVLSLHFEDTSLPGGNLTGSQDGKLTIKNIGKGPAYGISFGPIPLHEGEKVFTYKFFLEDQLLETTQSSSLKMYIKMSDGGTEAPGIGRFLFRLGLPENKNESGEHCAVIFLINYQGLSGKWYHSIFKFYPRLILGGEQIMQFIKHGDEKCSEEGAYALCEKVERIKSSVQI